ncbi:hypothetical protein L249_7578 [Ophiocordyceps polyrhachis-furcata BCC 54312]|uniref:Uncharacterized protein n=1 Tax=Ophiocordyceps polyrhachis-furcata BCC 54312 TaxID=1330021 RepID=A0A367LB77_9HYPO|nr:hypothetical protein L249_7578 [Ophiocordyceps polyrhachis-furcata BCC 54312]
MRILAAIVAIVTTASAAPTIQDNAQLQRRAEHAEPLLIWKRFIYQTSWGRRKGRSSTPLVTTRRRKDSVQDEEVQGRTGKGSIGRTGEK